MLKLKADSNSHPTSASLAARGVVASVCRASAISVFAQQLQQQQQSLIDTQTVQY
jgi:hypothetical protein